MFFLRFLGRSTRCLGLWFFCCGLHLKNKLCGYIVMQLDRHLVLACIFNGAIENNFVPINLCAQLVLEPVYDVLCGNGAKRPASFARFQREDNSRFANSTGEFFGLVQFACFTFGAFRFEGIELPEACWRNFMRFTVWQ